MTMRKIVVGVVANIRKIKRLDDAIRAFAMVSHEIPNAVLRIVGGGDSTELGNLARSLLIGDKVEFCWKKQRDPNSEIQKFSVGLLTSESEGLSNAVIEYMTCAKPVVCTNTGGNPELVKHDETGFLAPVGDVEVIAGYLHKLLIDKDTRQRFGSAARVRMQQMCTVRHHD